MLSTWYKANIYAEGESGAGGRSEGANSVKLIATSWNQPLEPRLHARGCLRCSQRRVDSCPPSPDSRSRLRPDPAPFLLHLLPSSNPRNSCKCATSHSYQGEQSTVKHTRAGLPSRSEARRKERRWNGETTDSGSTRQSGSVRNI